LLLVVFREFSAITEEVILSERQRFRNEIISSIESPSKRAAICYLRTSERLGKEHVGFIYDALFKAVCRAAASASTPANIAVDHEGCCRRAA